MIVGNIRTLTGKRERSTFVVRALILPNSIDLSSCKTETQKTGNQHITNVDQLLNSC